MEGTPRAIIAGLLVGALLAIANLYVGLAVGLWDSGHVTAAVLGFGLLSVVGRGHGPRETVFAITAACAAGAMPAVTGLLGPVPALAQLHQPAPPSWALAAWGAALSTLGILIALLLRRRLIEGERLPFPSGIATAEVVSAMHAGGSSSGKARALLAAAVAAALFTWLRDGRLQWIPGVLAAPGTLFGVAASALTLGVGMSPLLAGIGGLVGLRVAFPLLLGAVVSWLGIVPSLLGSGRSLDAATAFLPWPAVGLLVGASLVALARLLRTFLAGVRDLAAARGSPSAAPRWVLAAAAAAAVATVALGAALFSLPILHSLAALVLAVPLAAVCGRSAGQTDVSPVTQVSQLAQALFAPAARGRAAMDIGAAAIVAGESAQTGVTLWSLRAGQILGASPGAQAAAALAGTGVGALVSALAYAAIARAGGTAGLRLAVPNAQQWRALAELAATGASALPPGAGVAGAAALAVGIGLSLLAVTGLSRFLPEATALGIGMLLPVNAAAAAFAGAAALEIWRRIRPASHEQFANVVAAGVVAGESVAGLAIAIATAGP